MTLAPFSYLFLPIWKQEKKENFVVLFLHFFLTFVSFFVLIRRKRTEKGGKGNSCFPNASHIQLHVI